MKQVERAVKQSEQIRKVATVDEARKMMKIGVWYETGEETLLYLALSPNRTQGQRGFLTYETDGRLPKPAPPGHWNPTSIG